MRLRGRSAIGALAVPLLLSGCNLVPMKRHLPVPKQPSRVQEATPEELVAQVNKRWDQFDTVTATVDMQLTLTKAQEGLAKDYPSIRGWIVMQKPDKMRVVGQKLGLRIFNMATDGKTFTVLIPPKDQAFEGPNALTHRSEKQFENLRPGFFYDAMMVRALDPDDYYAEISDTETIEDAAKKHLFTMPEYVLSITQHTGNGSHRDKPVRVITFHRDDLLPSNQDLYDAQGNLESQVSYSGYKTYGNEPFPTKVTIKRPLEGIQIVLTVEKVDTNMKLPPDEFTVKIPPGTKVQHLE
ncbi:MAG TPA: outer membrane lipoprotein-sorting protein [Terracidiphilus sp.]|jgi:outer membrane lipoprotein-sorting protein